MTLPREDVHCPACPNPDTAFTLEDVGLKVVHNGRDGTMSVTVSRPNWEAVMIQHLRMVDDTEHQRLYDLCITELMAAGLTADQVARHDVQAIADSVKRTMERTLRRTL